VESIDRRIGEEIIVAKKEKLAACRSEIERKEGILNRAKREYGKLMQLKTRNEELSESVLVAQFRKSKDILVHFQPSLRGTASSASHCCWPTANPTPRYPSCHPDADRGQFQYRELGRAEGPDNRIFLAFPLPALRPVLPAVPTLPVGTACEAGAGAAVKVMRVA
jgi:hypothetical protein